MTQSILMLLSSFLILCLTKKDEELGNLASTYTLIGKWIYEEDCFRHYSAANACNGETSEPIYVQNTGILTNEPIR